jgi:hypothetical protein
MYEIWANEHFLRFKKEHPEFVNDCFEEEWGEYWEQLYPGAENKAAAFVRTLKERGWREVVEARLCIGYNIGDVI